MFKLYHIINAESREVAPKDGIYTVYELGTYQFEYDLEEDERLQMVQVFMEDTIVNPTYYKFIRNKLISEKRRYFEDYFGFTVLSFLAREYRFNILVEKLKVTEIENIMLYLWEHQNSVFHNFMGRSSIQSKSSSIGQKYGLTSKFINTIENFYSEFKELYKNFRNLPHTLLRTQTSKISYEPHLISYKSIEWVMGNLDALSFDQRFKGHPDSIQLNNNYAIIDKIEVDENVISFNTYENEIILGAFIFIKHKITHLKRLIKSNVNVATYSDARYSDFRDIKKLPFIRLLDKVNSIERLINNLNKAFLQLFQDVKPRIESPKLTPTFANKRHYQKAYQIIRDLKNLKVNIDNEMELLNIKKLSQLYELYNLHIIINETKRLMPELVFQTTYSTSRSDNVIDKIEYLSSSLDLIIYYEPMIRSKPEMTNLIKICDDGGFYKPDYVFVFRKDDLETYVILDSKYSTYNTVKSRHLNSCVDRYIMDIGVHNQPYQKCDYLCILYPGDIEDSFELENDYFPKTKIFSSKPNRDNTFRSFLSEIINNNLVNSIS